MTGVLLRGLRDALRGAPMKASARKRLQAMGMIERGEWDRFSTLTARGLAALREQRGTAPPADQSPEGGDGLPGSMPKARERR